MKLALATLGALIAISSTASAAEYRPYRPTTHLQTIYVKKYTYVPPAYLALKKRQHEGI